MFPVMSREQILEGVFGLMWQQDGSGLNISWKEAWELDMQQFLWLLNRVTEQRQKEARAARG